MSDGLLGLAPRRSGPLGLGLLDPNPLTNPVPAAAQAQAPVWARAARLPIDAAKDWYNWRISLPPPTAMDVAMGFMPMGFAGAIEKGSGRLISKVFRLDLPFGPSYQTLVAVNPTEQMATGLLDRSKYKILRYLDDPATGDRYFWDANDAWHAGIADTLGVENHTYRGEGSWEGGPLPPPHVRSK